MRAEALDLRCGMRVEALDLRLGSGPRFLLISTEVVA